MKSQKIINKLIEYGKLCYPITLIYPVIVVLAVAFIAKSQVFFDINLLLLCTLAASLTSIANAMNQVADHEIDRVNFLKTPIVKGTLNSKEAFIFIIVLFLFSSTIAIFLGIVPIIIALISIIISVIYSFEPIRLKKRTFLSHISISFCYGVLAPLLTYYIFSQNTIINWAVIITIFLFTLGLTMQKDYRDVVGDHFGRTNTYLIKFGRFFGSLLHFIAILLPFAAIIYFIQTRALPNSNYITLLSILPIIIAYFYAVVGLSNKRLKWAYPIMTISTSIAIILFCIANL